MKTGLQINRFDWPGQPDSIRQNLMGLANGADSSGFNSIWVMDHFFQIGSLGPAPDPMLEAYTTLGFLAAVTEHATLGTMVTGVTYRSPALLIKAVTTLDVVSGGRAYLAIGAGWNQEEAEALELSPPLNNHRFERLEETLQLAQQMFADDQSPYNGTIYTVPQPINHPLPVSKPHPPILIGGGGEGRTLKLVAKYADASNLFARVGNEELKRKLGILRTYCDELGRDYDAIEKTALAGIDLEAGAQDPGHVIALAKEVKKVGIEHLIFSNGTTTDMFVFEVWQKKIIPELQKL